MLIGGSLLILCIIVLFSLVLGGSFVGGVFEISIDNEAIIDGISNTFVVDSTSVFFNVETGTLVGAIGILTLTLIGVATITGISVLGSGLNAQSAKVIVFASIYGTLWLLLSIPAFGLIVSIQSFGYIIYVLISVAYVVGVIQKMSGGSD